MGGFIDLGFGLRIWIVGDALFVSVDNKRLYIDPHHMGSQQFSVPVKDLVLAIKTELEDIE